MFAILACSKKPVILLPGLMGSILDGDIKASRHWYCPKNKKDVNVWFNDRYAVPPTYNCLFEFIKLVWNAETQEPEQNPDVDLHIVDFGGINGINHVDTLFFDIHIVPYYSITINYLVNRGYTVGEDIYGIPFDWRFGIYQKPAVWSNITQLIESIVAKRGQKVVLVGHSMGCFMIQRYLTEIMPPEWRDKNIDSTILIAPSFGGAGMGFSTLWTQKWPFLGFLGKYPEIITSLGGIHIHMLNHEIYGNTTVGISPDGRNLTARDLTDTLIDYGKLDSDSLNIFRKSEPFFQKAPADVKVPTYLIYNSALVTNLGVDTRDGESIYGSGDLMVNKEGPEWACNHWSNIKCHDLKNANPLYNHLTMLYYDELNEFVYQSIETVN